MSTEVKINTLKEKVYKMPFAEVWDYCKNEIGNPTYGRFKRMLMRELGMKDFTLRQRKRQMLFSPSEEFHIVKILNDFFDTKLFSEEFLFANAKTLFSNNKIK